MDENHAKFLDHLEASKSPVWLVARWLCDHGFAVSLSPTSKASAHDEWREHVDDGDLGITVRVEVKHLSCGFTSEADWPFPDFIVCAKHAWDNAKPKPYRICYLNKDKSHLAVLDTATRDDWTVDRRTDKRYNNVAQDFYICDPSMVTFGAIKRKSNDQENRKTTDNAPAATAAGQ